MHSLKVKEKQDMVLGTETSSLVAIHVQGYSSVFP